MTFRTPFTFINHRRKFLDPRPYSELFDLTIYKGKLLAPTPPTPPSFSSELREDSGYELREDGGREVRE